MSRRPLVAGNWKMNLLRADAERFCRELAPRLDGRAAEVAVFPSFPLLPAVAAGLAGTTAAWGGQDLHPENSGAHTGDVSGGQLADAGCTWVLCGHSERRHDHGEGDDLVAAKVRAAARAGLVPMICVGETADQRRAGATEEVLRRQLGALAGALPEGFAIAYEPVWAIGTGETATPEIAQQAHEFVRRELAGALGTERAEAVRILYGGSVKPGNAAELAAGADVDGFLVGGASLDPESFSGIIAVYG